MFEHAIHNKGKAVRSNDSPERRSDGSLQPIDHGLGLHQKDSAMQRCFQLVCTYPDGEARQQNSDEGQ